MELTKKSQPAIDVRGNQSVMSFACVVAECAGINICDQLCDNQRCLRVLCCHDKPIITSQVQKFMESLVKLIKQINCFKTKRY